MLTATSTVTVFLDTSRPIIRILLTEDVNGNSILDEGKDITGDGQLTVLPTTTNIAVQTVFGIFEEDTPALLTVKVNGKTVLSKKDFDAADLTFSTTINLKNGLNTIKVNLKDAGGLEPDPAALDEDGNPVNNLSTTVTLDIVGPTLTVLSTIYPFTAIAGTPGDPVVYQVAATDAETAIAKVEIFASAGQEMIAAGDMPLVLMDQWVPRGTTSSPPLSRQQHRQAASL